MSEPIKHHFVPEVYLQRFAINRSGDLYKLKVKPAFHESKPKLVNKSQVCYEPNMYRYTNEDFIKANDLDDPNFIEKNVFKYEDEEITNLFDKIDRKQNLLKSEYKRALQIILSIKKRNPSIRKIFMDGARDEEFMESRVGGLKRDMLAEGMSEEDINTIISEAKKKLHEQFKDPNARKDMYKNSILMVDEDIIKNEKNALNLLLEWSPIVYYTSNQLPFITSDNPGFTMKNGSEIHNTNLAVVDSLIFPISPRSTLQLKRNKVRPDLLLYQNIVRKKLSPGEVSLINAGVFHNCNEIIIGNIEEQLIIAHGYN
jgi:hypothetical protein